jgi:hypothetical protein
MSHASGTGGALRQSFVRTLGTLPSLRVSRNPLVTVGAFAVALYAAYTVANVVVAGDFASFAYLGFFVAAIAVSVVVLNDWHRGLYVFVSWLLFEDFARKFLGNNMMIYFGKDFLVIILYLSFYRARLAKKIPLFRIPFRLPLLAFVWLGFVQMFNPASTSIYFSLLGMKIYFLYVPLIFVGYAFLESEKDLQQFFAFTCILILIVAALGLAQSIIGPSFLNPATLQEDIRELSTLYRSAPISGARAYRPSSVFVSAPRFQDFLIVSWLMSLGYAGYLLLRSKRRRALAFTTVGVVGSASLMSASRGVFMWNSGIALIIIAGFLWGAPWREREVLRIIRAIQRTVLVMGLGLIALLTLFPEQLGSRLAIYSESLMPNSRASELVQRTQTYPLKQLGYAFDHPGWPYGYGMGTCSLGTQYISRILHVAPMNINVESGFGNLLIELGIVGLLLWVVLGLAIVISAWSVVIELRGTPWFPLAFAILLFAVLIFFPWMFAGGSVYQDYIINAFLWILLGILYRLREFPKALRAAQSQAISGQS